MPTLKDDAPSNKKTAILHFEYNAHDIKRNEVKLLEQIPIRDGGLAIQCMICAYFRPRSLRDLLKNAKLPEHEEHKDSDYF